MGRSNWKVIKALATMLVCASVALVSLPSRAHADACVTGSLASYIALGATGCTIGDKTFSAFAYIPGGTNQEPASSISVTPGMPSASVEGVTFSGPLGLSGSSLTDDLNISFDVTSSAGATIEDASFATLSGVGITGTGLLQVTEGLCQNGSSCNPFTSIFDSSTGPGTVGLMAHTTFTPTGQVNASKDIQISTGTMGAVAFSSITDNFSQVTTPEPSSIMLFGVGIALIGLCALPRRRFSMEA